MTHSIDIATRHGIVAGTIDGPDNATVPPILLAHGAGLGQAHVWMVGVRTRLADSGHRVMTFDYAYMHQGRRAPDRLPKLLDVHEAAVRVLEDAAGPMVLVGKSMGGRVGSHLVADGRCDALGLVYLGYPLVAMGKTEPRNVDHLVAIALPQLFISGTRDRLGPRDAIASVASSVPNGAAVFIEEGDHSLVPLKATGRTVDDSLDTAADAIGEWMRSEL